MSGEVQFIPAEVQEMVDWDAGGPVPPERIRFAPQSTTARSTAWGLCEISVGVLNPWRKAHTRNYWAWWSTGVSLGAPARRGRWSPKW